MKSSTQWPPRPQCRQSPGSRKASWQLRISAQGLLSNVQRLRRRMGRLRSRKIKWRLFGAAERLWCGHRLEFLVWVGLYSPRVVFLKAVETLSKALSGHVRAYLGKGCIHIDGSPEISRAKTYHATDKHAYEQCSPVLAEANGRDEWLDHTKKWPNLAVIGILHLTRPLS